ncbi:hypothetical protein BH11MYX3_BH11MYX3_43140 [soil metagenome]
MLQPGVETRRLLQKLIRETGRAEVQALEHPAREGKRLGETPPVRALAAVAEHATEMQARFTTLLEGHELAGQNTSGIGTTLATLRHLVVDRVVDPERSFRTALLDLRHGIEVVKLLREITRREMLFGLIRWCDDWLGARRTLVARVEAQLSWFAEQELLAALPASVEDLEDDFEPISSSTPPDQRDHY